MSILIYSDKINLYGELISAGKLFKEGFGGEIIGLVIGANNADQVNNIADLGFSKILVYSSEGLNNYNPVAYLKALQEAIGEFNVKYVLMNSSYKNKILSGLIASKINAGLIVDVSKLELDNGKIIAERPVYSGKALAKEEVKGDKAVLLIKPGVFKARGEGGTAEVIQRTIDLSDITLELTEFVPKAVEEGIKLDEADVVIGGGRGIRKKEDLEMLKELASILGGAWGVTRPLAADYGWASEWIGISGVSIRPKLYIAAGISGQPQHTSGIRESKIIVAINKDSEAPIFKFADYGVIGDLYQVLPKLIEKLKKIKEG